MDEKRCYGCMAPSAGAAFCPQCGYPAGKENITGYMYEPWHVRYVGVELATEIHALGVCLEEYLGITSEYAG